jgi:hypothetical protein
MPMTPAIALVLAFVFLLAAVVVSAALDSPDYVTASLLVLTALSLLTLLAAVAHDLELIPPAWRERKPSETSKPASSRLSEPDKSSASGPASPPLDDTHVANARPYDFDEDTPPAETNETISLSDPEPGAPGTYEYSPENRPER